jgi:hypothetical protein
MSVSYLVVSHDFRAYSKRRSKARSAVNTGCICQERNAAAPLAVDSRRASQPRPLAALRLLTRAPAIACETRLASDLGWRAEMMRNNQIGHLNLDPRDGVNSGEGYRMIEPFSRLCGIFNGFRTTFASI